MIIKHNIWVQATHSALLHARLHPGLRRTINHDMRFDDLRVPPGNHLETLKGNRSDQYSIRINDQWRLCFRWTDAGVEDVEIVDYH